MGRAAKRGLALAWERRIKRQRRSRLSVTEFCSQEGVSSASFYAWRRRLLREESAGPHSRLFVPIELPTPAIIAGGVRIELPGGAVLSLPADAPLELVTAAIRAAMPSALAEQSAC
jgi:hypothetical protein